MDTLGIIVGKHLCQQVEQHFAVGLLGVKVGGFSFQQGVRILEYLLKGFLILSGEHAYLTQLADAVAGEYGELLSGDEVHNNGASFRSRHQFIQVRFARDG